MNPEDFRNMKGLDRDHTQDHPAYFTFYQAITVAGERRLVMEIYPSPTEAQVVEFILYTRDSILETDGSDDGRLIMLPYQPLYRLAYMMALNERGEEIGEPGNLAEQQFNHALATARENEINLYERTGRYTWARD